jgi:hypothetical protein
MCGEMGLLNGCAFHVCIRGSVWAAEEADQDDRATRSASFDVTGDTSNGNSSSSSNRTTNLFCVHPLPLFISRADDGTAS